MLVNWQDWLNPLSGGAEVHLKEIFTRLVSLGHSVTLFCSSFPGAPHREKSEEVEIIRAGGRFSFDFTVFSSLQNLLSSRSFDVIIEDINKIPCYTPLFSSLPTLAIVPHLFGTTVFKEVSLPLALYVYAWERPIRWIYRKIPFMVISESTKSDLVKRGLPASLVKVIYPGIDHSQYFPTSTRRVSNLILYVGRVKRYKRLDILLRAMARVVKYFPQTELVIVGEGDARAQLMRMAQKLLPHNATFTGYVTQEEKLEYLQRATLLVNPSPKEGWGLTSTEASACGLPVVVADAPGLRDSCLNGESGLLFRSGDSEDLAAKIMEILENKDLRKRLSEGGVKWAGRFTWDKAAEETLKWIEEWMDNYS